MVLKDFAHNFPMKTGNFLFGDSMSTKQAEYWDITCHLSKIDTPALCIDADALQHNIALMAEHHRARGKHWRPHSKCHKSPDIALQQVKAGALGVTCAKVSEAEVFAAAGIRDILIANMIVGEPKWERIARLCRKANPIVACDHYVQAEGLSRACRSQGVNCRVIVEVDIGMQRVGVRPGRDAQQLAEGIDKLKGVKLVGIMGYEGHLLRVPDPVEKRRLIVEAMGMLTHSRDRLLQAGLCCDIVSAGGTGSYQITADCDGITELQAGGGIFGDPMYVEQCGLVGHKYALSVLCTVVSRPSLDRAIVDAGRKSVTAELHLPLVKGHPKAVVTGLSAEHGKLELTGAAQNLRIGDKLQLIVGYADFTTPLHESFIVYRNSTVEDILEITARGCLQ